MLKSTSLFLVVSLLGCSRAACPPTGDLVMAHTGDATKYVVCREGTEVILGCDDETVYNPLTKRCESSRHLSERAPTCLPTQTITLFFTHETSCSQFYTCAYGITNLMYCPEGLEYYPEFRHCDWPSPNGCFAHTTNSPPSESTTKTTTKGTTETSTKGITKTSTKGTTETSTKGTTKTSTKSTTETSTKGTTKTTTTGTTETSTEGTTDTTTKGTTEIVTDPITETTPKITSESPTDSTPIDPPVKCPLNGTIVTLLPHPTKCDTFYLCWDGKPTMLECEFDYEFNVAAGGCVLISDSGCTASKTSTTEITTESTTVTPTEPPPTCSGPGISYAPHPTNCQVYLICYDGELAYIGVCDPGYEFDLEIKGCALVSDSGCTAYKTSTTEITTESTTETTTECTTEITTESTTESTTVTSTDPTPIDPPVKCPLNETDVTLLPHPTKCDTFYICWDGKPTIVECEFDYEFDVAAGGCVLISDSGCTASKTSTTEITTESTTVTPTEPPSTCSGPGISYVPHPTNCQIYLICYDGELAYIGVCDPGYEFDYKIKGCAIVSDSGCTAYKTSTTEITTESTTVTSTSSTPIEPPVKCPQNETVITLLPHPTKCDSFYICWKEIPTMVECSFGYEFNIELGGCVLISDSGCTASKTTIQNTELVTRPTSAFIPECDPDTLEITLIPHPTNCQVYYVCWGGTATSISCIYDHEFDVATGKCVPISFTGCTASKTTTLVWSTSTESSSSISDDSSPADEADSKALVVNKSARNKLFSKIVSKMALMNRK